MNLERVFIIAEAGVNHNGDINVAKKMIDAAVLAGADAVKFQTFVPEKIASQYAPKAEYQIKNTDLAESQLNMLKKLALTEDQHIELIKYCQKKSIQFLSAPFDLKSIDLLTKLGLKILKSPSGEITNLPYLRKIGSLRKKIIISTGMASLIEVEEALRILLTAGMAKEDIIVLHCNTAYPTPYSDVNLKAMTAIKHKLKVTVGYSDHTLGIEVPIAAVALGARVIEKHFTLDRKMPGPDHKASLEPDELKLMVKSIRNIELALGSNQKQVSASELKNINIARKSIVAAKNIKQGEVFTEANLAIKRPGNGISPMLWDKVLGKKAKKDFQEDELIVLDNKAL